MDFKILNKSTHYKGFFQIDSYEFQHELFAGGWSATVKREIFERGDAVAVLLHDPETDDVLLVEQFRPGAAIRDKKGAWMLEIVAGIVEEGESNEEVARRESVEEAGCVVNELEHVIDYYPSAGGSTERVSIYYAPVDLSEVSPGLRGLASENEDIKVSIVSRKSVMEWLQEGKIQSSLTIIALQWLALKKCSGEENQND